MIDPHLCSDDELLSLYADTIRVCPVSTELANRIEALREEQGTIDEAESARHDAECAEVSARERADEAEELVERMKKKMRDLLCAAEDALEFIKDYEDVVDGDYGAQAPNRAMQIASHLRDAIEGAEGAES